MRGKLLISAFVGIMGLIIMASPVYMIVRFHTFQGENYLAKYVESGKATNARDTVLIPVYQFTRNIGPVVQSCSLPMQQYAHGLDSKPKYAILRLKVGDKCTDYIVLDDPPSERIPLLIIGLILLLLGGILFIKAKKAS